MESFSSAFAVLALVIAYLLPTANAYSKRHRNRALIAVVNLFFGWTILGWLVCLAWSAGSARDDPAAPSAETHVKCPDCAELVRKEAKVCKHCGCRLVPQ
jgi:uncharacterized OB-fold protein